MNYQKTGKELMSQDEIAVMDGGKCILQVRGVMMQVKYYARACGRVQGVGFRYFVQYSAVALQIGGWVRNCDDGSVDMYLNGDREAVEQLLRKIRKGSMWIQVDSLDVIPLEDGEAPDTHGFSVKY